MTVVDWRHCPLCAGAMTVDSQADDPHVTCASCGFVAYDNPAPTTIALVVRGERLLLLRRAQAPGRGFWDTPGGFLREGETAEEGLRRELREEIGCEV